jgi:hypothetical protein
MPRRRRRDTSTEGAYTCESCGETIVIPVDITNGESQELIEDCPVCCVPHVVHIEFDDDEPRVWAERE